MDFQQMTVEQMIEWMVTSYNQGKEIKLDDIKKAVAATSVKDPIAKEGALTIFYSGGEDEIANLLSATDNENIRLIRRTEAFQLLSFNDVESNITFDKVLEYSLREEHPELERDELKKIVNQVLYGVSESGTDASNVGEGMWTQISARFAAETRGDAYSLCVNARDDRIFARDELKQWLAAADDDAKMGGITKKELMKLPAEQRFAVVKRWTQEDLKNTFVYVNSDGIIVGRSFEGTIIGKEIEKVVGADAITVLSGEDYYKWVSEKDATNMNKTTGSDSTGTDIKKNVGSDVTAPGADTKKAMGSDNDTKKTIGSEAADTDANTKEGSRNDSTEIDTKKTTGGEAAETDTKRPTSGEAADTDTKKTTGGEAADTDTKKTTGGDATDTNTKKSTSGEVADTDTKKTIGGDNTNTDAKKTIGETSGSTEKTHTGKISTETEIERNNLKQSIIDDIDDFKQKNIGNITEDGMNKYMAATGKTADELSDFDKTLIAMAEKLSGNAEDTKDIAKIAEKYSNIAKVGEKIGGAADILCTAFMAGYAIYRAYNAYQQGETNDSIGIVTGCAAELAFSTFMGMGITSTLLPYFTGVGAVIGGPIGAAIGGLLAGIVGYGVAGMMGSWLGQGLENFFASLDDLALLDASIEVIDPLVLDLNGDGLHTLSLEEGVYYDYLSDGFDRKTGWLSEEDGFLVYDKNQNGIVDNGSELFGNTAQKEDGSYYGTGLEMLKAMDSNQDGVIDSKDDIWSQLAVWQDKNSDGISQKEEMLSMDSLGITQFSLESENIQQTDNGNMIVAQTEYMTGDGESHTLGEIDFAINVRDTKENTAVELSKEIEKLPQLQGMGRVKSLRSVMQEKADLKELVEQYSAETDMRKKMQLVEQIVTLWTDCENIEEGSRGDNVSAKHLEALEKLSGQNYHITVVTGTANAAKYREEQKDKVGTIMQLDKKDNPNAANGKKLEEAYAKLLWSVALQLDAQTSISLPLGFTRIVENEDGSKYLDYTFAKQYFEIMLEYDAENTLLQVREYMSVLNSNTDIKDIYNKEEFQSAFTDSELLWKVVQMGEVSANYFGTEENDVFSGKEYGEIYYGAAGNDTLRGYAGDDILYGGVGNDYIDGGTGNDLLFGGEGDDRLYGYAGNDILYGGVGADYIDGGEGDDYLFGGERNDILNGGTGADILVGGLGDDTLNGGLGADTYIHNLGDGNDTINNYDNSEDRVKDRLVFGEGIRPEDIVVSRVNNDMLLTNQTNGEVVRIQYAYLDKNGNYFLENVEFADGTVWKKKELQEKAKEKVAGETATTLTGYSESYGYTADETMYGGSGNDWINGKDGDDILYGNGGNDTIYGEAGADILVGGLGDDTLNGGLGADTYIHNLGDGNDIIIDNDNTENVCDILEIGAQAKNIMFERKGIHLLLKMMDEKGETNSSVTIQNWYTNDSYKIEEIRTEDGYILAHTQVDLLIQTVASFEESSSMGWRDAILSQNVDLEQRLNQVWIKRDE